MNHRLFLLLTKNKILKATSFFKIILPSGTRVNIEIRNNRWLNIDIYPSFTDWNQTEGICGTYNGKRNDDLTDRNGQVVGEADFIKSWRYDCLDFYKDTRYWY